MEQLLFDGSWLVGLEYSQIYLSGSENFYEKTFLQVRESIVKLYSLVVILNEGIALLENNLENFEKDLFEVTELYENGFEEIENVEQIKITLAQASRPGPCDGGGPIPTVPGRSGSLKFNENQ